MNKKVINGGIIALVILILLIAGCIWGIRYHEAGSVWGGLKLAFKRS